jgi:hypothetical protein
VKKHTALLARHSAGLRPGLAIIANGTAHKLAAAAAHGDLPGNYTDGTPVSSWDTAYSARWNYSWAHSLGNILFSGQRFGSGMSHRSSDLLGGNSPLLLRFAGDG